MAAVYEGGDLDWRATADGLVAIGQKGKFQIVQVATTKIGDGSKPIILMLDGHTIDRYHDAEQAKRVASHMNALHESREGVEEHIPPATVVVTRHPALVQLLIERGLVQPGTPVISHATPEDVRGRHVIGVLPMPLAALAVCVTEVQINMAPEDRGVELPIERLRAIAGPTVTYRVARVPFEQCGNVAVRRGLALEAEEEVCPVNALGWSDPRFNDCRARAKAVGRIETSKQVYEIMHDVLKNEDQEVFCVLLVNVRREFIDVFEVNRGKIASVEVSVRKVLKLACVKNASGTIIVHQHPSGKANPSEADGHLTETVKQAFKPLGDECRFVDHVVIGKKQAYSFTDKELHHF